jgi:lipopolysaccharide biosynthesis protein
VRDAVAARLAQDYAGKVIDIRTVPNRGRDIGPFLTAFGAALATGYDLVGHIHTKKTADIDDAPMIRNWYRFLLENLLGGRHPMLDICLGHLAADPSLGIVFPDDPNVQGWERNRPEAEGLARRLGLADLPEQFLFPVGTMFWARVEALRPLWALHLDWHDYPAEPLPYDGTLLHAIERLLPFVAAHQGLRAAAINVRGSTR